MEGIIRKIIIGRDPKDAMAYYVGMRAGNGEVSAIVLDDRHLHNDGQILWKAVDEMPCIIEFDCNF